MSKNTENFNKMNNISSDDFENYQRNEIIEPMVFNLKEKNNIDMLVNNLSKDLKILTPYLTNKYEINNNITTIKYKISMLSILLKQLKYILSKNISNIDDYSFNKISPDMFDIFGYIETELFNIYESIDDK